MLENLLEVHHVGRDHRRPLVDERDFVVAPLSIRLNAVDAPTPPAPPTIVTFTGVIVASES